MEGGARVLEVGIPFSDPVADGPGHPSGAPRALHAGGRPGADPVPGARASRERREVPVVLFTYLNPVLAFGLRALRRGGPRRREPTGSSCWTSLPSRSPAGSASLARGGAGSHRDPRAPTPRPGRGRISAAWRAGFVYVVSREGVTGTHAAFGTAWRRGSALREEPDGPSRGGGVRRDASGPMSAPSGGSPRAPWWARPSCERLPGASRPPGGRATAREFRGRTPAEARSRTDSPNRSQDHDRQD